MEIRMNLYADWRRIVLSEVKRLDAAGFKFQSFDTWKARQIAALSAQEAALKKAGANTQSVEARSTEEALRREYDESLIHTYLDFQYRIPDSRPRKIKRTAAFQCPKHLERGLATLETMIKEGRSLFPYLSRQIFNASEQDGMLFDWGILHFHLGTDPDAKYKGMIKGTREILYAIVAEDDVYFLLIAKHGLWANKALLQLVKKEFPHIIEPYKLHGVLPGQHTYSERDHLALRAAGASPATEIDGELYFSPGGGINTAGGSMTSTSKIQQLIYEYEIAERLMKEELQKRIASTAAEQVPDHVEFRMEKLERDRISVVDIEKTVRVCLYYNEARTAFEKFGVEKIDGT